MDDSFDSNDPEQQTEDTRSIDDPELEKTKKDTAEIFYQFVLQLYSRSSSNAVAPPQQCLPLPNNSKNTTGVPSTLPRSKSREATRKDPHPKAVHSTRSPLAQIHHCSVELEQPELKTAGNQSNSKPRPDKLYLSQKHKRVPSSHSASGSDSSGKTTPAQDPPLDLVSPVELSSSYPPMSLAQSERREGLLMRSAEHAGARSIAAVSAASCTASQERERHSASAVKGDPCAVKARMIADRLRIIGDDLEDEYIKSKLEDLTSAIGDAVINNDTLQAMFIMYTQSNLSWRKVAELFKLLCRVMETTRYDQFSLFQKVWFCLLDSVVPWIQDRGGWSALPRETDPGQANTPNVRRRPTPLNPAQSVPVLPHSPTTPHCQPLYINGGASTISRIPVGVRTPQMMRHPHPPSREQSSPCLPRECSYSQHSQPESSSGQGRTRLWSLTSSGRFKREEDGVEDNEHSISELDMTLNDDDDEESEAFGPASQEDEEENTQEAEQTLTMSSLQSAFHASASFSNSSSPPIVVPSPHSNSQPETVSVDEFPGAIDSGIDACSLSLSCSPILRERGVSFTLGGVHCRPSSSVHGHNQTSLTSLSSAASASPIHTSPSSRKNSSNGTGSGYFSDGKTRPRSGGSLKEPRKKRRGDSPPCHRTSSLISRPHSRHHQRVATPTNETLGQSAASGHNSWMETPVRRVSTSAAVIYELVKDLFGGSP